jgi:hypothetical protein
MNHQHAASTNAGVNSYASTMQHNQVPPAAAGAYQFYGNPAGAYQSTTQSVVAFMTRAQLLAAGS